MLDLNAQEARLIAIYRAIEKFGRPEIIPAMDASVITEYVTRIIDLDSLETACSSGQLEFFLDGLVLGLAASRLLEANVPPDELPIPKQEAQRQFQTGIGADGEVRVNS